MSYAPVHNAKYKRKTESDRWEQDVPMRELLQLVQANGPIEWTDRGECPTYDISSRHFPPVEHIQYLGWSGNTTCVDRVWCTACVSRPGLVVARKLIYLKERAKEIGTDEAEILRDLRYPHVVALIGTYIELDNSMARQGFGILLYPAAEWNLEDYMAAIWNEGTHNEEKIEHLQSFFVCLAQGLSYLHASGVRHKDIKPRNILIDSFGKVLFTDFGISKMYPDKDKALTETERRRSYKYCDPEVSKHKPRDWSSDVFCLGAVFAEMSTLILRKPLKEFEDFRKTRNDDAFHQTIEKVKEWFEKLIAQHTPTCSNPCLWHPGDSPEAQTKVCQKMITAIPTILEMLHNDRTKRPAALGLWEKFQRVSSRICPDCDPRSKMEWPIPVKTYSPTANPRVSSPRRQSYRGLQSSPPETIPEDTGLANGETNQERNLVLGIRITSSPKTTEEEQIPLGNPRTTTPVVERNSSGNSESKLQGPGDQRQPAADYRRLTEPDSTSGSKEIVFDAEEKDLRRRLRLQNSATFQGANIRTLSALQILPA